MLREESMIPSDCESEGEFERLSIEWCRQNTDPGSQKYVVQSTPKGMGVVYAYIRKSGSKRAYVGKSIDFVARHYDHQNRWRWPDTRESRVQLIDRKIHQHGIDNFQVFILYVLPIEELEEVEISTIERFKLYPPNLGFGYNLQPGGGNRGLTEETRSKCKRSRELHWERLSSSDRDARMSSLMMPSVRQKAAESNSTTRQTKRLEELEYARSVAVPFVKSKKARAKMRAELNDCSGYWKNPVLYMISEDASSILSVNKDGSARPRDKVGPVSD